MKIFKYRLREASVQVVNMPRDAILLSVQVQDDVLCLWALVDPARSNESREFHVVGTGQAFDVTGLAYVGSAQQGPYVWHVFEDKR